MFEQDKKQIYYVNSNKHESDSNDEDKIDEIKNDNNIKKNNKIYIYLSIITIIILLSTFIGFIFGRSILEKHRKKKAFELDENYYYSKKMIMNIILQIKLFIYYINILLNLILFLNFKNILFLYN